MGIIKKIAAVETYSVRLPVLRKGKPIESCHFEGDDLETTLHFGLYLDQELVGIISLFLKSNPNFSEKNQYQIRGMAVLENHRKKDFGKVLLAHCEKECKRQDVDLIWFNARTEAVGFYEKGGYQKTGTPFEIPDVGEHIVMFKKSKNE
ncbi:Acetyltransferase (GNAT) domain-containing protein [Flavobacterium fluvii]|uniref:Acetyltransferase (GNAT) domain-containing protein n=1 Tax=Flavobacterium fluvii TaxID=468056 RepID=A0A1M5G1T2_9FLAO|nr:GNAT family N-acetyltransferase [Flavobacterium fluvii]SHF97787.1 Acetyltransferase (GNAT) domain-containing protein [Flavobacterium fluvii]